MTLEVGDRFDRAGSKIKLESMVLEPARVGEMSESELLRAHNELQEVMTGGNPRRSIHHVRALALLNAELIRRR